MTYRYRILAAAFALAGGFASAETAVKPSLDIVTLDGRSFDLAAHRGHWVIVNFWATWRSPCIKEMPDISAFVAAHKEVAAIGIAWEDTERAEIDAFVREHPVSYPLAQGDLDHPPKDFEVPRGLPVTYVIAPDGTVKKKFTGPITGDDLERWTGSSAK
jgi:thiol-disulfide isomerase/thioredoxin